MASKATNNNLNLGLNLSFKNFIFSATQHALKRDFQYIHILNMIHT